MYGLHIRNIDGGVSVLQKIRPPEEQVWGSDDEDDSFVIATGDSAPPVDWDSLQKVAATAEASQRLWQEVEGTYVDEDPVEFDPAAVKALARGKGLRGGPVSHILAPSASRRAAAADSAANARAAANTILAAGPAGDMQAVTDEILTRVRAEEAEDEARLPPQSILDEDDEGGEVSYRYHYGHSKGKSREEASERPAGQEPRGDHGGQRPAEEPPPARRILRKPGLVSLYVEAVEEQPQEPPLPELCTECPDGHALERWTCRKEGKICVACGNFPVPKYTVLFGCRICDWHLCSLHGAAKETEPDFGKGMKDKPAKTEDTAAQAMPEDAQEGGGAGAAAAEPEEALPPAEEAEERRRPRPVHDEVKLTYKEKMQRRMDDAERRRARGKEVKRYEWTDADRGETSAVGAQESMDLLQSAVPEFCEPVAQPRRQAYPDVDLPEDFCPLCHMIKTGASMPLRKGGHTNKPGCSRFRGKK